jgi:hypothetical protein
MNFSNGAPERIRTPDLLIRSQALYPAELRARIETNNLFGRHISTQCLDSMQAKKQV